MQHRSLFKLPLESIPVIYNGLDFSLLEPRRPKNDVLAELGNQNEGIVRIGTAAILRRWKRIELLLTAMAALRDEPVHCYVFGDGPAKAQLEALAVELGVANRVSFPGTKCKWATICSCSTSSFCPPGPRRPSATRSSRRWASVYRASCSAMGEACVNTSRRHNGIRRGWAGRTRASIARAHPRPGAPATTRRGGEKNRADAL